MNKNNVKVHKVVNFSPQKETYKKHFYAPPHNTYSSETESRSHPAVPVPVRV